MVVFPYIDVDFIVYTACLEDIGPALLSSFQYTNLNFYKLKEVAKVVNTLEGRRKPRKRTTAAA